MSEPRQPQRLVAESAKKSVSVKVRLTRVEARAVEGRAQQHDPPTIAAWLRDLIAAEIRKPAQ